MKKEVVKMLHKALKDNKIKVDEEKIASFVEIPPSYDMGDFAFPCHFLAKELKENPAQIALNIRGEIKKVPKGFEDIQTEGPYINFSVDRKQLALNLLERVWTHKGKFGSNKLGKEQKVMVEFSQPNTHKAFHVGHIRGTSLGESLSRIFEFCDSKVIRANYSGDTGMHIAKWIWCYQKYHAKEKLKDDESWIASIYVDAVKRLGKNKKFQEEVDEINRKIETKSDKKINELWKKTRKLSIDSWDKIYAELGTKFNVHYFESQVEKRGKEISLELEKKGIAKRSDDAVIMDLKEFGLSVWVLLRKDGTVLYSAKDLALAEKKMKDHKLDKSIIVIGDEQDLHFRQLFKTLELMKFKKANIFSHVPFNMVRLPTGKMSSRTGDNILYSDFIKEILDYARKGILQREPKISKSELEKRSLVLSIASIKYAMLKQNPHKVIVFKKEDALNFEGDTGPYILYSYARANSILGKVEKKGKIEVSELEDKEIKLVKKISEFPSVVEKAHENLNPALIANYSYQLAQAFNEFYHDCPVMNSENESFRLKLVETFMQVLKNALDLLGIDVLEKM